MRPVGGALLVAAAALAAAGCGTGGPRHGGNAQNGKSLFTAKCGGCHVLADAGTKGTIGPNLDYAFSADKQQGYRESGIQQVVLDQIRIANPPMPRNLVTGQSAADVSYYVALCAASTSCNVQASAPAAAAPGGGSAAGPAAKGQSLYSSLGCQSCHSLTGTKGIGPSFKGLYGSTVSLNGGKSTKADDAYLIQSIEDPDKQIVAGFRPGIMSAAIKPHSVSQADAKALVAYIKTLK